jgi:hypothetical protein
MGPQAHNMHYDSILFQNKETVLIYSLNSKVLSICTGIIIVQWLSPFILIKFTTGFDSKTEYPDFTSFFHYIQSFLPRPQTC